MTIADGLARRQDNFLWLRIVAALLVIYGHSFPLSPHAGMRDFFLVYHWGSYSGDIAVNAFFVISGFMVSASYLRRAGIVNFMKARLLRLVPALVVCVVLSAVLIGPAFTSLDLRTYFSSHELLDYISGNLRFTSGMTYHLPGVFNSNPVKGTVNGSLWTLPAELRMYELLAAVGAIGLLRQRALLAVLLLALIALGIANPSLLPFPSSWVRVAGYFVLGIIAQLYAEKIAVRHEAMVAIAFLAYWAHGSPLYPLMFALALTYFCFWFAYGIKLPSIERFGDPSYGAYLWGWPLLQIFAATFPGASPHVAFAVCGIGAIVTGYLSWHLVERWALKLKSVRLFDSLYAKVRALRSTSANRAPASTRQ